MPTVLLILGWRLFFYSNEGNEPIHIHAEKADMECKFWIIVDEFEIKEAFAYNLTPAAKKEIRKIIYQHLDLIVDEWDKHFKNEHMPISHKIQSIDFDQGYMLLVINDQHIKIKLQDVSPKLNAASDAVRKDYTISPSGYGIHWPQIDEDLAIEGLLKYSTK